VFVVAVVAAGRSCYFRHRRLIVAVDIGAGSILRFLPRDAVVGCCRFLQPAAVAILSQTCSFCNHWLLLLFLSPPVDYSRFFAKSC